MKRRTLIALIVLVVFVFIGVYFALQEDKVHYLPFDIPGKQMAATIPPFGMFIEKQFKDEGDGNCTILAHEKIHWQQYETMGILGFYATYISQYLKHGRVRNNSMEQEAHELSCDR